MSPLRQSPLPQNPLPLNLRDLELLHHYTTSTCLTLSSDPSLKALWRINVPQIGFRADYVMHTILSISALHLAHYLPEKREYYAAQGKAHHQSGLRMATSLLANVTNDNCDSIYIFSTMTLFITLATSRTSEDFLLLRNETNGGWLELLKGTYFIIRNYEHSLINSSLSAMFVAGRKRENLREEASLEYPADTDDLQELRYHISDSQLDPHTYSLCTNAIEELRMSLALAMKRNNASLEPGDVVFVWLYKVNNGFLELVSDHCQEAIVIFAYFCALLKMMDTRWWMQGSGINLLNQVWDLLDEQHRLWIRWPIEEIGWVPDPDRAAAKIDPSLISNTIQVPQGPQAQPMDKMYQEHSPHSSVFDHSPQPNNYMSPPGPST
ncbi:hypothetical protein HYFRA_00007392 [Hymenoscyphus fraxineus]|uniref:C6 transcription factor n=1 Tax=Hymenoscyphus fraxineus TaxID=746836 RepID=A0A9N9KQE0_9HELO|nr:hypothetical protein HYFRA_00007392 [Hymenoscyphus fraxineus]